MQMNGDEWGWIIWTRILFIPIHLPSDEWVKFHPHSFSSSDMPCLQLSSSAQLKRLCTFVRVADRLISRSGCIFFLDFCKPKWPCYYWFYLFLCRIPVIQGFLWKLLWWTCSTTQVLWRGMSKFIQLGPSGIKKINPLKYHGVSLNNCNRIMGFNNQHD